MHVLAALVLLASVFASAPVHALDKVDPYICPSKSQGSGLECFLEGIPQTYTMCRQVKSIEVIEFGINGAQEGVNGAKTDYCIEKHRLSMDRPFQAALRESARDAKTAEGIRRLYAFWLESLARLIPAPDETDDGYKQRVVRPYGEFNEQIGAIRLAAADATTVGGAPLLSGAQPRAATKSQIAKASAKARRAAASPKDPKPASSKAKPKQAAEPAAAQARAEAKP